MQCATIFTESLNVLQDKLGVLLTETKAHLCNLLLAALQALEKSVEAGGALDQYEIEGPDRAELLQDLAEFQLAAVSSLSLRLLHTCVACIYC